MDFEFVFFTGCLIGLIAFSLYSIRAVRRADFARYIKGLLIIGATIIHATGKFVMGFIGLMAANAVTDEERDDTEEDYLTGVYNFRTRKYDNGADPYGWYEEDL